MRGSVRSVGPVLAIAVAVVAMVSCGDDEEKDPAALCEEACDALNNCGRGCKPAEFIEDCTKKLEADDKAKAAEVACITSTACDQLDAQCYGSKDLCAGVSCTSPQLCNPESGQCENSECRPRDMDQPCTGDEFCYKAFCVNAYPRTYRFTYRVAVAPSTKEDGSDWDDDGPPDLMARIWVNGTVGGTSGVLQDTFEAADLNQSLSGSAKFEILVNAGDDLRIGLYDADSGSEEAILECTPDDLPNTLRFYTGMNCSQNPEDPGAAHFEVNIDPV